jgi:hypothetical protein
MLVASRRRPGFAGLLRSRPARLTPRMGVAMLGILVMGARALVTFGA